MSQIPTTDSQTVKTSRDWPLLPDKIAIVMSEADIYCSLPPNKATIRLLHLNKRISRSQTISGTLKNFELERAPSYVAISYMWGDEREQKSVVIDGVKLSVRRNLWTCLDTFTRIKQICCAHHDSREIDYAAMQRQWIFIDQICINQSDVLERSQQVGIMDAIFQAAICVVAWVPALSMTLQPIEDDLGIVVGTGRSDVCSFDFGSIIEDEYWFRFGSSRR